MQLFSYFSSRPTTTILLQLKKMNGDEESLDVLQLEDEQEEGTKRQARVVEPRDEEEAMMASLEMQPLSTESDHDKDAIIVWLNASKWSKEYGHASRPGNYVLDKCRLPPPDLLLQNNEIDINAWHRLWTRLRIAKEAGEVDGLTILLVILWTTLMSVGNAMDDRKKSDHHNDDEWWNSWWYWFLFVTILIASIVRIIHITKKHTSKGVRAVEKILAKMKQTFANQGFALSLCHKKNCVNCTEHGVRIQRLRRGRQQETPPAISASSDNNKNMMGREENDDDSVFDPQAWHPLQGLWTVTDRSSSYSVQSSSCWSSSRKYKVEKSTLEVTGVDKDETLMYQIEARETLCFGMCCVKDFQIDGRAQGNTLVLGTLDEDRATVDAELLQRVPERYKAQFEQVIAHKRLELIFYPLLADDETRTTPSNQASSCHYFRNRTGGSVWKVHGSTMIQYFRLEDDNLTDSDILNGALEARMDRCGENDASDDEGEEFFWIEFERVSARLSQQRRGGLIPRTAGSYTTSNLSARLLGLKLLISLTFAAQMSVGIMVVIFACILVSSSASQNEGATMSLAILAGACAIASSVWTLLMEHGVNSAPLHALVWSFANMAFQIVVMVGLGLQNQLFRFENMLLFSLSFPAGLWHLYFILQWRKALEQPTSTRLAESDDTLA